MRKTYPNILPSYWKRKICDRYVALHHYYLYSLFYTFDLFFQFKTRNFAHNNGINMPSRYATIDNRRNPNPVPHPWAFINQLNLNSKVNFVYYY